MLAASVPTPTALFPAPRLRDLRLARRLSQARLAAAAGVARDSIGNLENGGVARAETIERLARALQVEAEELMTIR
jgi:transcriptional regulator with XRE-family HTH domain